MEWISVEDRLPDDGERVLAFLPKNVVYLPGKSGDMRFLPVIPLRFARDFFAEANPKREKFGPHFWLGEGQSNHYFDDVSHWMPVPAGPGGEVEELRSADD
ncbi:MAG: DUF551 domain-containing protein [Cryomorphaceae bacterium]|nr:DUF551 domain-containing protein [Flavobacteriales bacterium]